MVGEVEPDRGQVTWGYETWPGYFAQDQKEQFENPERVVHEWMSDFCPDKDIGYVRGRLALMLFEGDDVKKRLSSLSGGEAARLVFARLALERPNVLVLDEPTNHLDLESIEALVEGLKSYPGTLILVSHDRWFIGQLATRIVDIQRGRVIDYQGTYDEYVQFSGDDHLDTEKVVLKAKAEKRKKEPAARREQNADANTRAASDSSLAASAERRARPIRNPAEREREKRKAMERQAEVTHLIGVAESRIAEIQALFADPAFYGRAAPDEVRRLEGERAGLEKEVAELMVEWERGEETIAALG
jgi:ATPase subunit of ABC transporter with duplicated ATPase domains